MLELLRPAQGHDVDREQNHLYGRHGRAGAQIIDVFICKLRKKLANASNGKNYIETGVGPRYVLREPSEDEARIPA